MENSLFPSFSEFKSTHLNIDWCIIIIVCFFCSLSMYRRLSLSLILRWFLFFLYFQSNRSINFALNYPIEVFLWLVNESFFLFVRFARSWRYGHVALEKADGASLGRFFFHSTPARVTVIIHSFEKYDGEEFRSSSIDYRMVFLWLDWRSKSSTRIKRCLYFSENSPRCRFNIRKDHRWSTEIHHWSRCYPRYVLYEDHWINREEIWSRCDRWTSGWTSEIWTESFRRYRWIIGRFQSTSYQENSNGNYL